MTAVFGITGWKNTGKTTLVAALVAEFTKRGFQVSTIKHAHSEFQVDNSETDSHKHRQAGAQEVAIVSDKRWALIHEVKSTGAAPTLDRMLAKLAPCDIVIVEGFKNSSIAKIECRRDSTTEAPIWTENRSVVATACETRDEKCTIPQFYMDDISSIADYVAQTTRLGL